MMSSPSILTKPNGFNAKFYQTFWNTLQPDIHKMIFNFFSNGTLDPRLNETILVLVPKKEGPVTIRDHRSISLCNVFYKILSKLLVHRLRPILARIIFPTQGAFVHGRRALD